MHWIPFNEKENWLKEFCLFIHKSILCICHINIFFSSLFYRWDRQLAESVIWKCKKPRSVCVRDVVTKKRTFVCSIYKCMESTHALIMLESARTATIGNTKQSINVWSLCRTCWVNRNNFILTNYFLQNYLFICTVKLSILTANLSLLLLVIRKTF